MDLPADDESDMISDGKKQKDSVLVAVGENHLGKQLAAMIDRMGYDFVVASNGEEALDLRRFRKRCNIL